MPISGRTGKLLATVVLGICSGLAAALFMGLLHTSDPALLNISVQPNCPDTPAPAIGLEVLEDGTGLRTEIDLVKGRIMFGEQREYTSTTCRAVEVHTNPTSKDHQILTFRHADGDRLEHGYGKWIEIENGLSEYTLAGGGKSTSFNIMPGDLENFLGSLRLEFPNGVTVTGFSERTILVGVTYAPKGADRNDDNVFTFSVVLPTYLRLVAEQSTPSPSSLILISKSTEGGRHMRVYDLRVTARQLGKSDGLVLYGNVLLRLQDQNLENLKRYGLFIAATLFGVAVGGFFETLLARNA